LRGARLGFLERFQNERALCGAVQGGFFSRDTTALKDFIQAKPE
jgi:hypothetical protein